MKPRIGPRTLVYENRNMAVFELTADFGAFQKTYLMHDHGERVGIVAVHDARILMVHQYRLLIDGVSMEIPGGRVEASETPAQAAARECREEARVAIERLEPLVSYLPGMDTFKNPTHIFLAHVAREEEFTADQAEVVERRWLTLDDCLAKIFAGEIKCGLTIMGMLAYAQRGKP